MKKTPEIEPKDKNISGYWECPACGTMNRPENQTCYFRCIMNEELIQRPEQLNG